MLGFIDSGLLAKEIVLNFPDQQQQILTPDIYSAIKSLSLMILGSDTHPSPNSQNLFCKTLRNVCDEMFQLNYENDDPLDDEALDKIEDLAQQAIHWKMKNSNESCISQGDKVTEHRESEQSGSQQDASYSLGKRSSKTKTPNKRHADRTSKTKLNNKNKAKADSKAKKGSTEMDVIEIDAERSTKNDPVFIDLNGDIIAKKGSKKRSDLAGIPTLVDECAASLAALMQVPPAPQTREQSASETSEVPSTNSVEIVHITAPTSLKLNTDDEVTDDSLPDDPDPAIKTPGQTSKRQPRGNNLEDIGSILVAPRKAAVIAREKMDSLEKNKRHRRTGKNSKEDGIRTESESAEISVKVDEIKEEALTEKGMKQKEVVKRKRGSIKSKPILIDESKDDTPTNTNTENDGTPTRPVDIEASTHVVTIATESKRSVRVARRSRTKSKATEAKEPNVRKSGATKQSRGKGGPSVTEDIEVSATTKESRITADKIIQQIDTIVDSNTANITKVQETSTKSTVAKDSNTANITKVQQTSTKSTVAKDSAPALGRVVDQPEFDDYSAFEELLEKYDTRCEPSTKVHKIKNIFSGKSPSAKYDFSGKSPSAKYEYDEDYSPHDEHYSPHVPKRPVSRPKRRQSVKTKAVKTKTNLPGPSVPGSSSPMVTRVDLNSKHHNYMPAKHLSVVGGASSQYVLVNPSEIQTLVLQNNGQFHRIAFPKNIRFSTGQLQIPHVQFLGNGNASTNVTPVGNAQQRQANTVNVIVNQLQDGGNNVNNVTVNAQKPAVDAEKAAVSAEKTAVSADKTAVELDVQNPAVSAEKTAVNVQKPAVNAQKPAVNAEKTAVELDVQKPAVDVQKPGEPVPTQENKENTPQNM